MKIPSVVKVGAHRVKVKYPYFFPDNAKDGVYNSNVKTIYISGDCDPLITFWHEVVHVVDEVYNNDGLTEEQVLRLSEGLYQVLADNFKMRAKSQK